jgi:hypothetical protein
MLTKRQTSIYTVNGKIQPRLKRCKHCRKLTEVMEEKSYKHAPTMLVLGYFTLGLTVPLAFRPVKTYYCRDCGGKHD